MSPDTVQPHQQAEKATHFATLHEKGNPCVLYNIWDAGGARAVEKAGAAAIATGSWSVAAAQGYDDGELIPLELVERIVQRISAATALPLSVDIEGGYGESASAVAATAQRIIEAGAIGINFEDRVVGGSGLYETSVQSERIVAIRESANEQKLPLFINARTDLFLQAASDTSHSDIIDDAKARASAYEDAGASGLFVPGLIDTSLIGELCQHTSLPVNIMMMDGAPTIDELASVGVSRVSFGPSPYLHLMNTLSELAEGAFSQVARS